MLALLIGEKSGMANNRMKKFFQYLIVILLFSFWGTMLTNRESFREEFKQIRRQYIDKPCTQPIKYSIGTVDARFDITQADFQKIISQAEIVWEDPAKKNLFEYDSSAEFRINLVYDDRQKTTEEAKEMENQLNSLELKHDEATEEYDSLSVQSKKKISDYNKVVDKYKDDLDDYNREVRKWNQEGGAPEDEYEKLKEEKENLDDAYRKLEKQRKEINELINKANSLAQKSNQTAQIYNSNLNTYKNKFGESREFDKGVYDGKSINIYQFEAAADLRLVVVHELGHALGLDHLSQPASIMYYMMGEQDLENPKASNEDILALKQICNL